jgi:hypothetical protein
MERDKQLFVVWRWSLLLAKSVVVVMVVMVVVVVVCCFGCRSSTLPQKLRYSLHCQGKKQPNESDNKMCLVSDLHQPHRVMQCVKDTTTMGIVLRGRVSLSLHGLGSA